MDFQMVDLGWPGNEQDDAKSHNSGKQEKCTTRRHTACQIARLEELFNENAHPDECQRREMGAELGLDPIQIKFWFQNKRTKVKTLSERFDNNALRHENEQMQSENFVLRETLKNVFCSSCRSLASREEEYNLCMQKLKKENALLQQEYERICKLLATNCRINPMLPPTLPTSHDPSRRCLLNQKVEIPARGQRIPTLNQLTLAVDQDISTLTPGPDQHTPALAPTLDQDIPILIPALDQDVSATTTPPPDQNIPALTPPLDQDIPALISAIDQDISAFQDNPALDLDFDSVLGKSDDDMSPNPLNTVFTDTQKALMTNIANTAMEELIRLLCINEPFWSRSVVDGKFILQRDTYERIFHRSNCLNGAHARIESSKDSRIVRMCGTQLVDMFLNSDKWVDLFPTIVKKAQTIQVLESGWLGSQSGTLQLMNAEMHILSPLVPTREFVFLRYCKQVDFGVWVIADVTFDSLTYDNTLRAWRFPSGCIIHEMTNGSCRVSWIEHVEVDDKIQTDKLFREVICSNNAYGAERWVLTLERMCQRFASASLENIPSSDAGGVISSAEGRRSVMELGHRMVKMFCGTLDMSGNLDFPHFTKLNNGGVRVSVRKSTEPGVPDGMIISAATSFRLPLSPQNVFNFLNDNSKRLQWDVLCNGNAAHEIQRISHGSHPGNCTSIIRPFIPKENYMMILQESYVDRLGSMLVYAPIDIDTLNVAIRGEDSSELPLLPSGFTISGDGRSNGVAGVQFGQVSESEGSLVTLAYQVLACSLSAMEKLDMESIATVNTLVTSTVEKIKVAFNCSYLD